MYFLFYSILKLCLKSCLKILRVVILVNFKKSLLLAFLTTLIVSYKKISLLYGL